MKTIVLFISLVIFSGCAVENDTVKPNDNSINFPLTVGNWWKYKVHDVDYESGEKGEQTDFYTLTVKSELDYKGKDAFLLEKVGERDTSDVYIAKEFGKIYIGGNSFFRNRDYTPDWVMIYDSTRNTWESMNLDYNEAGDNVKFNGICTNEGDTTVSISGKIHRAVKLKHTIKSSYSITSSGIPYSGSQTTIEEYLFVNNVGFYQILDTYFDQGEVGSTLEILSSYETSD